MKDLHEQLKRLRRSREGVKGTLCREIDKKCVTGSRTVIHMPKKNYIYKTCKICGHTSLTTEDKK